MRIILIVALIVLLMSSGCSPKAQLWKGEGGQFAGRFQLAECELESPDGKEIKTMMKIDFVLFQSTLIASRISRHNKPFIADTIIPSGFKCN